MIPASLRKLAADTERREASDLEARHKALHAEAVALRERAADRGAIASRERARLDGEYHRIQLALTDLGERREDFERAEQQWNHAKIDQRLAEIANELRQGLGSVVIDHGRAMVRAPSAI